MKIYSIRNKEKTYGYLLISNNYEESYIELVEGLNEYPAFFNMFVLKKNYVINSDWTSKWINERIIPYSRQNINDILTENKIPYYNELLMLIAAKAHSSMDDNYIEQISIDKINNNTKNRMNIHILDFIYSKDNNGLIVFFKNGKTKFYGIKDTNDTPFISSFNNEIIFNSKIRYSYLELYNKGIDFMLSYDDLKNYINNNILSSAQVTSEFGFTRQYLHKLKKNNDIEPLNNNLYLRENIAAYNKK